MFIAFDKVMFFTTSLNGIRLLGVPPNTTTRHQPCRVCPVFGEERGDGDFIRPLMDINGYGAFLTGIQASETAPLRPRHDIF